MVSPALAGDTPASPEAVLDTYLRALYARDSEAAYALLSGQDQAEKTLDDYRRENGSFSEAALLLSHELANSISFDELDIKVDGDWAIVTLAVTLPNANDPSLASIVEGFNTQQLAKLTSNELGDRLAQLHALAQRKSLPVIQSTGEQWDLIRENGQWRVFENWASSIMVEFDSVVVGELGWKFEPLRTHVLADPGQTIAMAYRATNTSVSSSTGKARHIIGPDIDAEHLEIVSCFCFLEQTLEPGEEIEMPLVFRVDFDAPESIKSFNVLYEFYRLDEFPEDDSA